MPLAISLPRPYAQLPGRNIFVIGPAGNARLVRGMLMKANSLPVVGDTIVNRPIFGIQFSQVPPGAYLLLVYNKESPQLESALSVIEVTEYHALAKPTDKTLSRGIMIDSPKHADDCPFLLRPSICVTGNADVRPLESAIHANGGSFANYIDPMMHDEWSGDYMFFHDIGTGGLNNPYAVRVRHKTNPSTGVESQNLHVEASQPHSIKTGSSDKPGKSNGKKKKD